MTGALLKQLDLVLGLKLEFLLTQAESLVLLLVVGLEAVQLPAIQLAAVRPQAPLFLRVTLL